jgi:uncharacterized protein YvpB
MGEEGPSIFKGTIPSFVQKNVKNAVNVTGLVSSGQSVASTSTFLK